MTRTYSVTFKDVDFVADFLEQAAAFHNIPPAIYIMRCIADGVAHMYPAITMRQDSNSLDEFFIGHGLRKPDKTGWQNIVLMAEPGDPVLEQLREFAASNELRAEELALQCIREMLAEHHTDVINFSLKNR